MNPTRMRCWRLSSAIALVLLACSCSSGGYTALGVVHGALAVQGSFRLVAMLRVADVELREIDGTEVRVDGEVLVRTGAGRVEAATKELGDAHSLPFAAWVSLVDRGDTVAIGPARGDTDHQLRLHIGVPRGARTFVLGADVGRIDFEVASATEVTLGVATGQVRCRAEAIEGRLEVNVGTGEFEGDLRQRSGGVDLRVGVGAVRLRLPEHQLGDFLLDVDVGGITGFERFGLREERVMTSTTVRGGTTGQPKFVVHVDTGQIALE